jgi:hypothetical protein
MDELERLPMTSIRANLKV